MEVHQILASVRALLDEPNTQHPTERHLWTIAIGAIQNYHNELQETGQNWDIGSWQLSCMPDVAEYPVLASNFGKPLYILSYDPNPDVLERTIPIVDIQNRDYPPALRHAGPYWEGENNATSMAFYGKGPLKGNHYVRVRPTPKNPDNYTIWYKLGPLPPNQLSTELLLPEHHHLLMTRIAISALPYCRWDDLDKAWIPQKVAMLTQSFMFQNQQYQDAFDRYRTNLRQEVITPRVLFGEGGW